MLKLSSTSAPANLRSESTVPPEAPMQMASWITALAWGGPMEMTVTSPPY